MGRDKAQHLFPGVGGCISEFLVAAVEEAMCRARVDNNLMLDAGLLHTLLELMHLLYRNALVSAAKETQQGIFFFRGDFQHRSLQGAKFSRQASVEADYSGETEILGA